MEKMRDTSAAAKQERNNAALRIQAQQVAQELIHAQATKNTAQEYLASALHSALSLPATNNVTHE